MTQTTARPAAEPWLRGPIEGADPLLAPVLFALQQAREDLAHHTEGLTPAQIWMRPDRMTPLGFHLRHIAGSIDRLTTYLENGQLSEQQLAFLKAEAEPGAGREKLLAGVEAAIARAERVIRAIDPATLTEFRGVGRKQLPSTVIGLAVHIAEHTARHLGQAVSAAKLARVARLAD